MKLQRFIYTNLIVSLICLIFLALIPADRKNAWLFGLSPARLFSLLVLLAVFVFSLAVAYLLRTGAVPRRIGKAERILANRWVTIIIFAGSVTGVILGTIATLTFWTVDPKYEALLIRAVPLTLYAYILCIQIVMLIWPSASRILTETGPWDRWKRRISSWLSALPFNVQLAKVLVTGVVFAILGVIYIHLANSHATLVNREIASDQGANLLFSQRVVQSGYRYTGYRNQMPAYPYLLTLIYKPGLELEGLFERGKRLNIALSLILLSLLFIASKRFLSFLGAVTLAIFTAFGLYVFKAGYVQVEILYYFISFLLYVLMGWMFVSPSPKLGIATGMIAGLAHLSKASVLPGLILFLCLFFLKVSFAWLAIRKQSGDRKSLTRSSLLNYASGLLVLLFFLVVIYQYISESKRKYGQYFYNVNSTFYMWYDTWAEAKKGTRAFGDREGWPQMPPDEIPSLKKYLSEHTADDIIKRLQSGMQSQAENLLDLYGRFDYLLILFVFALLLAVLYYPVTGKLIRENFWLLLFALGYFIGYLILYAWYLPITDNENQRMTYCLFLPIVFSGFIVLEKIARNFKDLTPREIHIHPGSFVNIIYATLLILIFVDLATFIPGAILSNSYSK